MRQAIQELLSRIQQLKVKHPYWGYRRIWAYLKYHEKLPVNRKRIFRLMKENHLLVPKNRRLKAPRKAKMQKPRTVIPNRYWGIDMTKVTIPAFGWVYLHIVIAWSTKKLMNLTRKLSDWIAALNEAVNLLFPNGIRESLVIPKLVSAHGYQPTLTAFFKYSSELGIQQIFASYSNPKGNVDIERIIRTLKEDLVWPREFDSIADFEKALNVWHKEYNENFPHLSLDNIASYECKRWFHASAA